MKKLFTFLFIFAVFVSATDMFAQHNVDFKFKVRFYKAFDFGGGTWLTTTVQEGSFTEGVPYTIPEFSMPADQVSLQDAYNAIVGSTFGIDAGALNNDIRLEITLDGLNLATGAYYQVASETLFLTLDVDVYDPPTSTTPVVGDFWFNTGHPMMFKIPRSTEFESFVTNIGLDPNDLGFAYIDGDSFFPNNIETFSTSTDVWFLAEHLSKFGGGRGQITGTSSVELESLDGIPTKFDIRQNYPNPFNPTTMIRYEIPEAGFVNLTVYNILGKEVAKLVSMNQDAGIYEASFDAAELTSGMYFYTISHNNKSITKKMMLVK